MLEVAEPALPSAGSILYLMEYLVSPSRSRSNFYVRAIILTAAIILPAFSLILLGSFWLFQNGYLIPWALTASGLVIFIYLITWYSMRGLLVEAAKSAESQADPVGAIEWNDRELAAWQEIQELSKSVKSGDLESQDQAVVLGLRTIELVAKSLHPKDKAPLLKFTVPEALAVIERVSARLGPFVADNIPLGDRLTVRQMMAVYRWRSAAGIAVKAYDLWRVIRLLNPAAALANEVRERIAGQLLDHGREELAKRLGRAYVETVGAAAIDLYGGRLVPHHSGSVVVETVTKQNPTPGPIHMKGMKLSDPPKMQANRPRWRIWSQVKNVTWLLTKRRD
jgi:uncharacterized protein